MNTLERDIVELHDAGKSFMVIARQLNTTEHAVRKALLVEEATRKAQSNGSMALSVFPSIPGVQITETGADVCVNPDPQMLLEATLKVLGVKPQIEGMGNQWQWVAGAMLNQLRIHLGEDFYQYEDQIIKVCGKGYNTLMWVEQSIPQEIRQGHGPGHTWSHYQVLAGLEKKEQLKYLELSIKTPLTVSELRNAVKDLKPSKTQKDDPEAEREPEEGSFKVTLDPSAYSDGERLRNDYNEKNDTSLTMTSYLALLLHELAKELK